MGRHRANPGEKPVTYQRGPDRPQSLRHLVEMYLNRHTATRNQLDRSGIIENLSTRRNRSPVPLDLSAIDPNAGKALIEPRDIFASLGSRPWPRLRVEQDQVLKTWFDRRSEGDLVIKQNTGGESSRC